MPEWCNYYICRWSEICIPVGNTRHYFIISQWKSRFNDNPQNIASLIHLKTKSPFWKIRDIVVTYFMWAQKQKFQRSFKSVETSNLQALAAVWRKICKSTIQSLPRNEKIKKSMNLLIWILIGNHWHLLISKLHKQKNNWKS